MIRRGVLGALLLILPFSGTRMICLGTPQSTPETSQYTADCAKMCAMKRTSQGGTVCLLTTDDTSLAFFVFGVAVSPLEPHIAALPVVRRLQYERSDLYLSPDLGLRTPPPKA